MQPLRYQAQTSWEFAALPTAGCMAHFDFEADGDDHGQRPVAARTLGDLKFAPAVIGEGSAFDATQYVEFEGGIDLERTQAFSISLWIKPGSSPTGCVVSKMASTADARGFEVIWYKSQHESTW